jgi:hypothetical protein
VALVAEKQQQAMMTEAACNTAVLLRIVTMVVVVEQSAEDLQLNFSFAKPIAPFSPHHPATARS